MINTPAGSAGNVNDPNLRPVFRSLVFADRADPDFVDVAVVAVPPTDHALPTDPASWARAVFNVRAAPVWVKLLLAVRQATVWLIGIARAGRDTFKVEAVRGEEALIQDNAKHLDFRAGVAYDAHQRLLRVTTAVWIHNFRGRVYFLPVRLFHSPVTQAITRRAVRRLVGGADRASQ
jgi:hypothetical protein